MGVLIPLQSAPSVANGPASPNPDSNALLGIVILADFQHDRLRARAMFSGTTALTCKMPDTSPDAEET